MSGLLLEMTLGYAADPLSLGRERVRERVRRSGPDTALFA
jgi:hypothetical protein